MKSKHTPGPWKLVSNELDRNILIIDANWKGVANPITTLSQQNHPAWKNNKTSPKTIWERIASPIEQANARLIAAAPELLEALKQTIELVEQWRPDELDGEYLKDYDYILNKSREAINKAEGR